MQVDIIIQGDALTELRKLPDESFDLCLTDPPYGIGEAAGKNDSRSKAFGSKSFGPKNTKKTVVPATKYGNATWDDAPPSPEVFAEIFRVSKNQIIFGGNYFGLPASPCWLVWDKDNGDSDFADCELAWTSFKSAVRKFKYRWNGMLQEDMKHKEKRYHPTQKPVKLFMQIIEKYSKPGDLILDPYLGSGTTAIAAQKTGRKCVGIEREAVYVEIARKRIAAIPQRLDSFL
jgi:site-specific DNA-methyltransferase (adenine-specific)